MPLVLTIIIAKLSARLSSWLGRGSGSALPGLIAEKLDPQVGAKLASRLKHGSIIITGTNGKTTTTKMTTAIMAKSGQRILTNRSGSNLTRGLVSTLVGACNWVGHIDYDLGIFEVDEASLRSAVKMLNPKTVLVLNLFRDQLDRYGELDKTAATIGRAIGLVKGEVWLNADDPLVASLMTYAEHSAKVRYFGVEKTTVTKLQHDVTADSDSCPICGEPLLYSAQFFGRIGHLHCPIGHSSRPKPEIWLDQTEAEFKLQNRQGQSAKFELLLPGLYNGYNALAAAAITSSLGLSLPETAAALAEVEAAFGRQESFEFKGRQVLLLLIKNPTGFNQVIQTFLTDQTAKHLMIAINDKFADGRDVSWLWDVGFEEINPEAQIVASGLRAYDLAVRLKYANRQTQLIEPDLARAFSQALEQTAAGQTLYVLPTYTAMFELRQLLAKQIKLESWT